MSTHRSMLGVEGLATTFHDLSRREDISGWYFGKGVGDAAIGQNSGDDMNFNGDPWHESAVSGRAK